MKIYKYSGNLSTYVDQSDCSIGYNYDPKINVVQ